MIISPSSSYIIYHIEFIIIYLLPLPWLLVHLLPFLCLVLQVQYTQVFPSLPRRVVSQLLHILHILLYLLVLNLIRILLWLPISLIYGSPQREVNFPQIYCIVVGNCPYIWVLGFPVVPIYLLCLCFEYSLAQVYIDGNIL